MLLLDDHIKTFGQLLNDRSYNGYFMSNFGFPGKLQETIRKHIFENFISNKDLNPIHLSTYTRWRREEDPYVRCEFTVNYEDSKGFNIQKMDIHFKNQYGTIRSTELKLERHHDIPS